MTTTKRKNNFILTAVLLFTVILLVSVTDSARCGTNIEDKISYEKAQEQKVEAVLQNMLGPGKANVVIHADLDFSFRESVQSKGGGQGSVKEPNPKRATRTATPELRPGLVDTAKRNTGISGEAGIKRMIVTVITSKDVSEADCFNIRSVVSELLYLDTARGDDISIVRVPFAPVRSFTEMLISLVKYCILAFIVVIVLTVGACLLKWANKTHTD